MKSKDQTLLEEAYHQVNQNKKAMTDEQINLAIAEACGWTDTSDFCNDLNAMHEAEKTLENLDLYSEWLANISGESEYLFHTSARQRAQAFLETIGKWEE